MNNQHEFPLDFDIEPRPADMTLVEAESLAKPLITLFANANEESEQVFQGIEAAQIGVQVIAAPNRAHPVVVWGGNSFEGLEQIEGLLAAFSAMDSQLLRDLEQQASWTSPHRDLSLADWMTMIHGRQMGVARTVMAEIQSNGNRRVSAQG